MPKIARSRTLKKAIPRNTGTLWLPAFCDLHIHGAFGLDFMAINAVSEKTFLSELRRVSELLCQHGIAHYAPTLLTSEWSTLEATVAKWAKLLSSLRSQPRIWPKNAALPIGLHLEGPFLQPEYAGAHPRSAILAPTAPRLRRLLSCGSGHIRIVTLAPEITGAIPAIKTLVKAGVRVQLGHSRANTAQSLAAINAGARGLTHLFNAMRTHHRDPGLEAALCWPNVTAEIITDGVHVHPAKVYQLAKAGSDRHYAVSDCCAVAHAPKASLQTLGELRVTQHGGAAYVANKHGRATTTLAGSARLLPEHPALLYRALTQDLSLPIDKKTLLSLFTPPAFAGVKTRFFANFEAETLRFVRCAER
ncbi:MAG TPA: amidohydrolase family protein [Oligoflexia bacterium]|nr:amidohydrolase family protein [Oligoflexia bacterium]